MLSCPYDSLVNMRGFHPNSAASQIVFSLSQAVQDCNFYKQGQDRCWL